MTTEVKLADNGPIMISGDIKLFDADGAVIDTSDKKMVALCRCGMSTNRPFCNGAHKSWTPAEAAE